MKYQEERIPAFKNLIQKIMKNEFKFELEILEPRFEFKKPFFEWLWDAVCWLGDSVWDIVQGAAETVGVGFQPSRIPGTNDWELLPGFTFPGLFSEIWNNWEATFNEYWADSGEAQ